MASSLKPAWIGNLRQQCQQAPSGFSFQNRSSVLRGKVLQKTPPNHTHHVKWYFRRAVLPTATPYPSAKIRDTVEVLCRRSWRNTKHNTRNTKRDALMTLGSHVGLKHRRSPGCTAGQCYKMWSRLRRVVDLTECSSQSSPTDRQSRRARFTRPWRRALKAWAAWPVRTRLASSPSRASNT